MRRPSPALVVAILALIMSCAGTATAARVLITSGRQVRDGAIGPRDLSARALDTIGALSYVVGPAVNNVNGTQTVAVANCPKGLYPLGGGVLSDATTPGQDISSSFPYDSAADPDNIPDHWAGYVDNTTGRDRLIQAFAVCGRASRATTNSRKAGTAGIAALRGPDRPRPGP